MWLRRIWNWTILLRCRCLQSLMDMEAHSVLNSSKKILKFNLGKISMIHYKESKLQTVSNHLEQIS